MPERPGSRATTSGGIRKVRENIGFMSNATAIYDRLTAWETVEFFGQLNGLDKATLKARMEDVSMAADERLPGHSRQEAVDGHEAEGVDRTNGVGTTTRRC